MVGKSTQSFFAEIYFVKILLNLLKVVAGLCNYLRHSEFEL